MNTKPFQTLLSLLTGLVMIAYMNTCAAQARVKHVIIVTTDGFRWQELFNGANYDLATSETSSHGDSTSIIQSYWDKNPEVSRKKLLPFIWGTVARQGQIYGNRKYGNLMNVANPYWFSYPGYNELLTGYPDVQINSNDYGNNPNETLLHFLNRQKQFHGKVAAFGAWSAIDRILNKSSAGFPVMAAFDKPSGNTVSNKERLLNQMLQDSFRPWGASECLDVFTHYNALEYLKTKQPDVLYISYGETDDWAHADNYFYYLNAAHQVDKWLQDLWNYVQHNPYYKDETALVVTTDHGRGEQKWTSHGRSIPGSDQMWFLLIGPGIAAKGEIKEPMQHYQQQLPQTIASLLGTKFVTDHPVAEAIRIP